MSSASSRVQREIRHLVLEEEAKACDAEARLVLEFLNSKRPGLRGFRPTEANLRLIRARLTSGISVEDLRAIITVKARQVREGAFDPAYLRPATLFNALRCEQYLGELGDG